jgi:hypothetical protein
MLASNSFTGSLLELLPVVGVCATIDVQGLAGHERDRQDRRVDDPLNLATSSFRG